MNHLVSELLNVWISLNQALIALCVIGTLVKLDFDGKGGTRCPAYRFKHSERKYHACLPASS